VTALCEPHNFSGESRMLGGVRGANPNMTVTFAARSENHRNQSSSCCELAELLSESF
jgi:hypothetical protein